MTTIRINGLEYCFLKNAKGYPRLKMQSRKSIKFPKALSKYYALNTNNVAAFVNRELYASEPDFFNDLFDSNFLKLNFKGVSYEDLIKIYPKISWSFDKNEYETDPNKFGNKIRDTFYCYWAYRIGICCVADNSHDELMWAHYTKNYGFVVEFDYTKFPKNITGPYRMNYPSRRRQIKVTPDPASFDLGVFVNYLIKDKVWKYENEYRFILFPNKKPTFNTKGRCGWIHNKYESQDRLIPYPDNALKKVILGFYFFANETTIYKERPEYVIEMTSSDAVNKTYLLDNLIQNQIPIEMMVMHKTEFYLTSQPISLQKMGTKTFKMYKD